jgi:hypothetical protein
VWIATPAIRELRGWVRHRAKLVEGEFDEDGGPFPRGARDLDRSAQGLHPVAEPDQTRASRGIGASGAVVADREVQQGVALFDGDVGV